MYILTHPPGHTQPSPVSCSGDPAFVIEDDGRSEGCHKVRQVLFLLQSAQAHAALSYKTCKLCYIGVCLSVHDVRLISVAPGWAAVECSDCHARDMLTKLRF